MNTVVYPGDNIRDSLVSLAQALDSSSLEFNNYESSISGVSSGSITAISKSDATVLTTSTPHGLVPGRIITISGASTNRDINGTHEILSVTTNTITIGIKVKSTTLNTATFTSDIYDFRDILKCYNIIINKLNSDNKITMSNYLPINDLNILESTVLSIDKNTSTVTLSEYPDFIQGDLIVYKAIPTEVIYSPVTAGAANITKQFSEATMLFENRAFTKSTLSFSTDLFPEFSSVEFNGDGNGSFGTGLFGHQFFGGVRNSASLRTYVPVYAQRCSYLTLKFNHNFAREKYSLFGISLVYRPISTRAYWK